VRKSAQVKASFCATGVQLAKVKFKASQRANYAASARTSSNNAFAPLKTC